MYDEYLFDAILKFCFERDINIIFRVSGFFLYRAGTFRCMQCKSGVRIKKSHPSKKSKKKGWSSELFHIRRLFTENKLMNTFHARSDI